MDKDSKTINLKLPTRWEELTQKQLRYLFSLIAQGYSIDEVKAFCLFRWNKITILHRIDDMKAHNSCMDTKREVFRQFMSKLILETIVLAMRNDGRFLEVTLTQSFLEYGLWQDYGTGRETPRKSSAEGELAHTSAEAQPGLRSRNASWKLRRSRPCQNFSCKPNAESSSLEL